MIQFADQVDIRLISQLISGISRVFQKLLKQFNGIAVYMFKIPVLLVFFASIDLNLNDSEFVMLSLESSLWYYHRLPDVFE